ncbi:MAG TPA: envelope stress response membrane protein PspC [Stellaceae bacterium]|nr:envelope stress response membrane protein PspC [Stellaceae bacterium]
MWSDQRTHLYRDPAHGLIAGVCAGIADYLGVERIAVRIAFVIALFLFFPPTAVAYVILAIALPKRPPALYASREDEAFWHGVATAPDDALRGLGRRFADLETRLRAMERSVTSSEFDLHRKFRDLR